MKIYAIKLLIRSLKGVIAALEMEYNEKLDRIELEELKKANVNQKSD